jgi:hypothetical protein
LSANDPKYGMSIDLPVQATDDQDIRFFPEGVLWPEIQGEWFALARPLPYPHVVGAIPDGQDYNEWILLTSTGLEEQVVTWQEVLIGADGNELVLAQRSIAKTLPAEEHWLKTMWNWYDEIADAVMWVDYLLTQDSAGGWVMYLIVDSSTRPVAHTRYFVKDCHEDTATCDYVNETTGAKKELYINFASPSFLALKGYQEGLDEPLCRPEMNMCTDELPYEFTCDEVAKVCNYRPQYVGNEVTFSLVDYDVTWPIDLASYMDAVEGEDYVVICNSQAHECVSLLYFTDFYCSYPDQSCKLVDPYTGASFLFKFLYDDRDWVEPQITWKFNEYMFYYHVDDRFIKCNLENRTCIDKQNYYFKCDIPYVCAYQHKYTDEYKEFKLIFEPVDWSTHLTRTLSFEQAIQDGTWDRELVCSFTTGECLDNAPYLLPMQCDFVEGICRAKHAYTGETILFEVVQELPEEVFARAVFIEGQNIESDQNGLENYVEPGAQFRGLSCDYPTRQCSVLAGIPTAGGDITRFVCINVLKCDVQPQSFACLQMKDRCMEEDAYGWEEAAPEQPAYPYPYPYP